MTPSLAMSPISNYLFYCEIESLKRSLEMQQERVSVQEAEKLEAFISWTQENEIDPRGLCDNPDNLDSLIELYNKILRTDPKQFGSVFGFSYRDIESAPEQMKYPRHRSEHSDEH